MSNRCVILCLATLISLTYGLVEVPDYIHVCQKSNPKLVDCIIESVENLRPLLNGGIPELNIPGIEPLKLGNLLVTENTNSNGLTISATDILAFGPSNFKIKKLDIVRYGEEYHFDVFLPHLYVEGAYNVDGRILFFPVKASGKLTGNFTSCIGSVKGILSKHSSNDENVSVSKAEIKIKVGKGSIHLQDLFGDDKIIGDVINESINQNFELFSQDIIPLVEKALLRTFTKISNKIFNRYTYSQLFPLT